MTEVKRVWAVAFLLSLALLMFGQPFRNLPDPVLALRDQLATAQARCNP